QTWLKNYGYLPPHAVPAPLETVRQSAVASMQRFYGIPVTGRLDPTTVAWMRKPRCGVPDRPGTSRRQRNKRYALTGQKWRERRITYSISNFTPKVGEQDTRRALRRAFGVWQSVTPLSFQQPRLLSPPGGGVLGGQEQGPGGDIMIFFASGFHGDSSPFDGEGGFLAHAYFPGAGIGGDTHFDSDEPWTLGNATTTVRPERWSGQQVAPGTWTHTPYKLPLDDLQGIQRIYGVPTAMMEPTRPLPTLPTTSERKHERRPRPPRPPGDRPALPGNGKPNICDGNFNTVAFFQREMFVFKVSRPSGSALVPAWWSSGSRTNPFCSAGVQDRWFWRLRNSRVQEGYPMQIHHFWKGLPARIDAAYQRPDGKLVFFRGKSQCWWDHADTFSPGSSGPPGDRYWVFREVEAELVPLTAWWRWAAASPRRASTRPCAGSRWGRPTSSKATSTGATARRGGPRSPDTPNPWLCGRGSRTRRRGPSPAGRDLPLDDLDITVTISDVPPTVNAVAVVIPCILALCILVLVYTIFQFKHKGAPQTRPRSTNTPSRSGYDLIHTQRRRRPAGQLVLAKERAVDASSVRL
ncbi:unnamed protein product, partial [Tetraodon nigroviridis]